MYKKTVHSLFPISLHVGTLLSLTILTSGCLGIFQEQPVRYNTVTGTKRSPLLNPKAEEVKQPDGTEDAYRGLQDAPVVQRLEPAYDVPQSPYPELPYEGAAAYETAPPLAPAPLEPSPLYYYEQEQVPINRLPLEPSPVNADAKVSGQSMSADNYVDMTAGEVVEIEPVVEPLVIPQVPEAVSRYDATVTEPTTLDIAVPAVPVVEPVGISEQPYPALGDVPSSNASLTRQFDDVQQNADSFRETYVEESQDDIVLEDIELQDIATPEVLNAFVPIDPVVTTQEDIAIDATMPVTSDDLVVPHSGSAGIDYTQQPIALPEAPYQEPVYTQPVRSQSDIVSVPEPSQPYIDVTPENVATIGDVYEQEQSVYVNPIRLVPPRGASMERELRPSRYRDLRRGMNRQNLLRH